MQDLIDAFKVILGTELLSLRWEVGQVYDPVNTIGSYTVSTIGSVKNSTFVHVQATIPPFTLTADTPVGEHAIQKLYRFNNDNGSLRRYDVNHITVGGSFGIELEFVVSDLEIFTKSMQDLARLEFNSAFTKSLEEELTKV